MKWSFFEIKSANFITFKRCRIKNIGVEMCGIFFCIFKDKQCYTKEKIEHLLPTVEPLIRRRGPDNFNIKEKILSNHESGEAYKLMLKGAVLHLRGSLTSQPLEDEEGNVLIWNGEVFDGINIPENGSDTSVLSHLLCKHSDSPSHVVSVMSQVQGPWSFVYYQPMGGKIWFGRDYFGRRSLVWHLPNDDNDAIAVSSVAQRSDEDCGTGLTWKEVPADGIYCLETKPQNTTPKHHVETFNFNSFNLKKYPWSLDSTKHDSDDDFHTIRAPVKPFNKNLPSVSDLECLDNEHTHDKELDGLEEKAECGMHLTSKPDFNKARIFQEEAQLVHYERSSINDNQNIQSAFLVTQSCTHKLNELELGQVGRDVPSNPLQNNTQQAESGAISNNIRTLGDSQELTASAGSFSAFLVSAANHKTNQMNSDSLPEALVSVLGEAVRKRVFNLPRNSYNRERCKLECGSTPAEVPSKKEELCYTGAQGGTNEDCCGKNTVIDAKVGILFSGGLDSIVLAALADRFIPVNEAIDLINVAFEQKIPKQNPTSRRKPKVDKCEEEKVPSFDVPDRLTGRKGVLELNVINPQRHWNFIEVNVTLKNLQEARSRHITHMVSPLTSVLDDSIGCALWFAARGSGVLRCPRCIMGTEEDPLECVHPQEYTSVAKVLLVGMGADEQLGGYARHRSKFNQQGWQGLIDEMEMEVNRISERNLGRDDRCISDHGREARFPFLDEQVVSFLNGLPVWVKADLRLPRGTGEKILLRQAAKLLGLTSSAVLPKRAIQFGSRIAKLEGTSEKGSDTCSRLRLN